MTSLQEHLTENKELIDELMSKRRLVFYPGLYPGEVFECSLLDCSVCPMNRNLNNMHAQDCIDEPHNFNIIFEFLHENMPEHLI